jgi:peptidoglycan hydrolase CwlO-like protein
MTIEVALVISGISLAFGLFQGISNLKRNQTNDAKNDASQLTTVIVKLENIGTGITRIESEVMSLKADFKEDHERLVKAEESTKQAHKRITECKQQCKIFNKSEER